MQITDSLFINSANRYSIASDGALSQIELPLGRRPVISDSLNLRLNPSENDKEHEGQEGRIEKHDIPEYNILRVVGGGVCYSRVRVWRLFLLGDRHVVTIERSQYHGRHHEPDYWVKVQLPHNMPIHSIYKLQP